MKSIFSPESGFRTEVNDSNARTIANALTNKIKKKNEFAAPSGNVLKGTKINWTFQAQGINTSDEQGLTLELTYYGISNHYVTEFFEVLKELPFITSLLMNNSNLSEINSSKVIASYLATNPPLRVLDLHYSRMSKEGILAIIDALQNNTHLEYLNIRANELDNEVLDRLLKVISNGTCRLQAVELTQNNFPNEKAMSNSTLLAITQQLEINSNLAHQNQSRL